MVVSTPVTALNGATSDSWNIGGHYNGIEVSGVLAAGRAAYSVGWNAGSNRDVRDSEDVYGHVGVKFGGMRFDGEGNGRTNGERPWEETAITLDAFAYHSRSSVSVVGALLESASGAPPGGWESVGGFATGAGPDLELQNISIAGAFAF